MVVMGGGVIARYPCEVGPHLGSYGGSRWGIGSLHIFMYVQGYLAHKKTPSPRTLQQACVKVLWWY